MHVWRGVSDKSIRESEFMSRIGQNYSRKQIHVENRTKLFENQNSYRESDKSIRELELYSCRESNRSIRESRFMARIEQKYSRIRIHGENRTKVFEN